MRKQFRLFRRGKVFWCQNNKTGKQSTLGTKDRVLAERVLHAKNEAHEQPSANPQIARAYLVASDPAFASRTWQSVMNEILRLKEAEVKGMRGGEVQPEDEKVFGALATERRWRVALKAKALDELRAIPLLETRAEHFLRAIEKGRISTNVYLRRVHNFALAMNWLPVPVIPKRNWPKLITKQKRAITLEEHRRIVGNETNPERRAFYELAWGLGASQSDIAFLQAENIDWNSGIVSYERKKTGEFAMLSFGGELATILRGLPKSGPLFPYLRTVRASDRATEFKQRCARLGIKGVSLHSYRYAWAQRAKSAGYPERFAQIALGHNSKAVHRAYARNATVVIPSLDKFESVTNGQKKSSGVSAAEAPI